MDGDYTERRRLAYESLTKILPHPASLLGVRGRVVTTGENDVMQALAASRNRDMIRRKGMTDVGPELLATYALGEPWGWDGIAKAYRSLRKGANSLAVELAIKLTLVRVCGIDISEPRLCRISTMAALPSGMLGREIETATTWAMECIDKSAARFRAKYENLA